MSRNIILRPIPSDATISTLLTSLMIAALFLFAARGSAQTDQGAITGIVQDTSGAVIPNAQISVTDVDTGLVLQGKTNAGGVFVFSPLKIGNYTVTASAPDACWTALVTSSQASSSASGAAGWSARASRTKRRATGTSSTRRSNERVCAVPGEACAPTGPP